MRWPGSESAGRACVRDRAAGCGAGGAPWWAARGTCAAAGSGRRSTRTRWGRDRRAPSGDETAAQQGDVGSMGERRGGSPMGGRRADGGPLPAPGRGGAAAARPPAGARSLRRAASRWPTGPALRTRAAKGVRARAGRAMARASRTGPGGWSGPRPLWEAARDARAAAARDGHRLRSDRRPWRHRVAGYRAGAKATFRVRLVRVTRGRRRNAETGPPCQLTGPADNRARIVRGPAPAAVERKRGPPPC
jgi:hypothetical protein